MPLVVSKDEWRRIEKWTHRDKEDPEVTRRREYVHYLDATSQAMTKSWPNSLENVNKRNEELRRARLAAAEQANTKFYKRYVKRKHEEQERLMYSARDTIFKNKDAPKLLLSAVVETVIQKERIAQLKFLEKQRRRDAEQKRRDDDDIIRRADEWHKLVALKNKRRREVNKQHQKDIIEQAQEITERKRKEYEAELNLQKLDNVKAREQIDAIKKFDEDFKAAEKKRIWTDMERSRLENEQRRKEQQALDKMDERLIQVLLRSRATVDAKRRQTEKEIKAEKQRLLEQISLSLESGDAARDARDQEILNKAIAEKEAIAEARVQDDARKQQELRQQRAETRQQFLRDEERRLQDFNTFRQWDIMNRFKNLEISEDFQKKQRLEKQRKIIEYREDILKLWKERTDREARELAETRSFYGEQAEDKLRAADAKLLAHAAALVREARANGRPERALHRAVDRYCKMYRLFPAPPLPRALQAHFPRYAPCPDPLHSPLGSASPQTPPLPRSPQPAQPAQAPTTPTPVSAEDTARRDGLQHQPNQSKTTDKPQQPAEQDYKRSGRANGMQRNPAQDDVCLPPI